MIHGSALVRIIHEVDIALEDFRIEFERILDHTPVIRVLFVAQHVHEGAVVDAMHAQRAHEVSLEQPKSFGEQQSSRRFCSASIHYLAPEFVRHRRIKLRLGKSVLSA